MLSFKWGLALSVAAVLSTSALAEGAQQASTSPPTKQSVRAYCTDLVTQFNAVDTSKIEPTNLADAKSHAERGQMMCGTMPKTGVKELWVAFRTIGVEPK